jgi:hypothetical protein
MALLNIVAVQPGHISKHVIVHFFKVLPNAFCHFGVNIIKQTYSWGSQGRMEVHSFRCRAIDVTKRHFLWYSDCSLDKIIAVEV